MAVASSLMAGCGGTPKAAAPITVTVTVTVTVPVTSAPTTTTTESTTTAAPPTTEPPPAEPTTTESVNADRTIRVQPFELPELGFAHVAVTRPIRVAPSAAPPAFREHLEPGQVIVKTQVTATADNSQATNGDPLSLALALKLDGRKGTLYAIATPSGVDQTLSLDGWNVLSEMKPVAAPRRITGALFYLVDTNDTDLVPVVDRVMVDG
jgi:hypothetical protein